MQWLNEPPQWSVSEKQLTVQTASKTDFWRITHYDFIRDSGHFYFEAIAHDFIIEVKIRGDYHALYDQAGLMIRADDKHWIKTGIEFVDDVQNLSAVVTHDYSDWSMTPLLNPPEYLQLRVERRKATIQLFYWHECSGYRPFRMTYLPNAEALQVGMMCASPEGNGFRATFENYQVQRLS
ncbi:DUF1349 domain-containing protein [Synechococcus elongatus IITB7]|uniref:DUF1349 domain-containing protein n=1 Tax=Synechococcus elongatus TaxID=32046 RepID=UPI0030D3D9E5